MKRSEMVTKLMHKVSCPHTIISEDMVDMLRWRAERLLEFLEEQGMQPPNIKKYAPNGSLWNISPGWEPEDEKK